MNDWRHQDFELAVFYIVTEGQVKVVKVTVKLKTCHLNITSSEEHQIRENSLSGLFF